MSDPYEFTVDKYLNGVRVDSFLAKQLRNYTKWRLSRMVQAGLVTINSEIVEANRRVFTNETVCIHLMEPPDKLLEPESQPLDILHEDRWLLIVNKPAGIIAHPVGNFQSGTLCNFIQAHLDQQTKQRGILRPGIVHRLDRQTSGAIIIAKEHLAHRLLSILFQKKKIAKTYLAIVQGSFKDDFGTIDLPIGRDPVATALMSTAPNAIHPKQSITPWRVLKRFPNHTLVEAKPKTGRNHQIRVHFASIGHPLLGEPFYGAFGGFLGTKQESDSDSRHALHASELSFQHPITHAEINITAPMPGDFKAIF